jgi:broad specificity phosphatase PhoE
MKIVRLIRHGESAANVGAATQDHTSIPLTDKGVEQARQVALSLVEPPELIVASPFSRAQATAASTTEAFQLVPFETWPIQEFTYPEPARCDNTTVAQRRSWVNEYWGKASPIYIDGLGAESFVEFVNHARSFLDRVAEHAAQNIVVFSHGQFINAVAWLIAHQPAEIDNQAMTDWREHEIANHVQNCGGYLLIRAQRVARWTVTNSTEGGY